MRSLVSFLVFVLLGGCGSLKGCGSPATAPAPAAPAAASDSRPPAPEPPEARFARKYLVIVHSSPTPGEGTALVEKLGAAGLGADVKRLSSTPFSSLRPCLEVVVAGAFAEKEAALALSQRLDAAGIENYLKNSGALAKDWQRREADCREQAEARAALGARVGSAADPRFVDLRGTRTFVLLSNEPRETPGATLRQVGEDRGFWMAPLEQDPTGTFKRGDTFDVFDAKGLLKSGCRVKRFASLNRGTPHFGYFQQQEAPTDPGCGSPWPVAELDCSLAGTRAMDGDAIVFALPGGRPAPRYLSRTDTVPAPLKTSLEASLRALPSFVKARADGEAHARQQGRPLEESLELRAFPSTGRQVVVGLARFQTGDGFAPCGSPDYWATVSRVVAVAGDGQEAPVGGGVDGESIVAVLDLEGDGQVELLTRDRVDASRVALVREDGSQVAASFMQNCDCGC